MDKIFRTLLNTEYDLNALVEGIPFPVKPYTKLLEEIQSRERSYDQSSWGSPRYSPDVNACGSAMCIAGHFVHMAGKQGYQLKDRTSFSRAARLLHLKVHPTAPVFKYDIPHNEKGLSYIEMMAEYEQRPDQNQNFTDYINEKLKA